MGRVARVVYRIALVLIAAACYAKVTGSLSEFDSYVVMAGLIAALFSETEPWRAEGD